MDRISSRTKSIFVLSLALCTAAFAQRVPDTATSLKNGYEIGLYCEANSNDKLACCNGGCGTLYGPGSPSLAPCIANCMAATANP